MRLGRTLFTALAGAGLLLPATAHASPWRHVEGQYAQAATCVPSGGTPTANPTVWEFTCASGTTTWTEDLQGQTVLEDVRGTIDLLTGAIEGTAKETIYLVTPDGRTGTLVMTSVFQTFQNNRFVATNTIVGGSGDFAGARGALEFEGMTIGIGTYEGRIRTKPGKSRRGGRR